jgi:hypothetical protein
MVRQEIDGREGRNVSSSNRGGGLLTTKVSIRVLISEVERFLGDLRFEVATSGRLPKQCDEGGRTLVLGIGNAICQPKRSIVGERLTKVASSSS